MATTCGYCKLSGYSETVCCVSCNRTAVHNKKGCPPICDGCKEYYENSDGEFVYPCYLCDDSSECWCINCNEVICGIDTEECEHCNGQMHVGCGQLCPVCDRRYCHNSGHEINLDFPSCRNASDGPECAVCRGGLTDRDCDTCISCKKTACEDCGGTCDECREWVCEACNHVCDEDEEEDGDGSPLPKKRKGN